ncbi:uncharacterized protein LOC125316203 [Rhodamnia argentea]|uniref:Uncharacterized protein LOC125316203 n=1 Tax=Rhodamnia argentea TaxID=178133 RepID=A0ABM3HTC7_9MYRT|nr:uncharacterized protein LOC125316203 [Rhodamnia argentea]
MENILLKLRKMISIKNGNRLSRCASSSLLVSRASFPHPWLLRPSQHFSFVPIKAPPPPRLPCAFILDSRVERVFIVLTFNQIPDPASWEGIAHDSRVLADALSKPNGLKVPRGKYYLADAGYGIQSRFISPYHDAGHHLKEFGDRPPKNEKELFNRCHSSLGITVEEYLGC